jgi:hypothetical protein
MAWGTGLGEVTMAEDKQPFHQFPLALFAYGPTKQDKITGMIAYATISAGKHMEERLGGKEHAIEHVKAKNGDWTGFQVGRGDHRAWALGKDIVTYSWHTSPVPCADLYEKVTYFLSNFGKSPLVRVGSDLMQEADKDQFEFRDFGVLCAVYAIIGDKQYAIAHRDRVRAGALGYSSGRALFDESGSLTREGKRLLELRQDKAEPLTLNQCRYTLNRLHARKFFSRLQPVKCGRTVYYSRGMSHDELAEKLLSRLERRSNSALAQDGAEQRFREKAAALLKRFNSGGVNGAVPAFSPGSNRTVTAGFTGT